MTSSIRKLVLHLIFFGRAAPLLLEYMLLYYLIFDLLSLVSMSALKLLEHFPLHLMLLVTVSMVHLLIHLVILHRDAYSDSDRNRDIHSDSDILGMVPAQNLPDRLMLSLLWHMVLLENLI